MDLISIKIWKRTPKQREYHDQSQNNMDLILGNRMKMKMYTWDHTGRAHVLTKGGIWEGKEILDITMICGPPMDHSI